MDESGEKRSSTRRLAQPLPPLPTDPFGRLFRLNVFGTVVTLGPLIPFYILVLDLTGPQAVALLTVLACSVTIGWAVDAWTIRRQTAAIRAALARPARELWPPAYVEAARYQFAAFIRIYTGHVWLPTLVFSALATGANAAFDLGLPAWKLFVAVPVSVTVLPMVHAALEWRYAPEIVRPIQDYAEAVLGAPPDTTGALRRLTLGQKLLGPFLALQVASLAVVAIAAWLQSGTAIARTVGDAALAPAGDGPPAWVGTLDADGRPTGPAGGPDPAALADGLRRGWSAFETPTHHVRVVRPKVGQPGPAHIVAVRRDAVERHLGGVVVWVVAVGGPGILISLLVWFLFSHEIRENTRLLVAALERISRGDLDHPPKALTTDEFGELATRTADMMEKLRERNRLQDLFGRHTSPQVAKLLMEQEELLGGTRQDATILFSDIRSFTTMSEMLEPEAVVALLNRYFSVMVKALLAHRGRVDKFIGDGMLAVFGAPEPDPEHAANAVRSALAMREGLAALNAALKAEGRPELRSGIGIHSGPVLCGCIGSEDRMEFTVIGDTVNAASRIEGLSKKFDTDVVVSGRVYAATQDLFDYERRGAEDLKGKTQRLDVFLLKGAKPAPVAPAT